MVTYILRISYESGSDYYSATFNVYNYKSLGSFIPPSNYKIPNAEYLFSMEQFFQGDLLDERTLKLILLEIRNKHNRCITKLLSYELSIKVSLL